VRVGEAEFSSEPKGRFGGSYSTSERTGCFLACLFTEPSSLSFLPS